MRRASLGLGLLLLVVLSGCASPPAGRAENAALQPDAAEGPPGHVRGLAESDIGLPVPAADAVLEPVGLAAVTDAEGRFAFADVAPGAYALRISKAGFVDHEHPLVVAAGALVDVQIILPLVREPVRPLVETSAFQGFIHCSTNAVYASNACSAPFGASQDHTSVVVDWSRSPREILLELVWVANTPATGQQLELDVCAPEGSASGLHCADASMSGEFSRTASGSAPLTLTISVDEMPDDLEALEAWVGNGRLSPYPTVAQSFTLYKTVCYVASCPEGLTAQPS